MPSSYRRFVSFLISLTAMIVTTNKLPMKTYLDRLKVEGKHILSKDTTNYLLDDSDCCAYEFLQENREDDHEFLRLFTTWLHEQPRTDGYVEYYLLLGLRYRRSLKQEEFEFLEREVTECFASSHGWYYELIVCRKRKFLQLIKKTRQ